MAVPTYVGVGTPSATTVTDANPTLPAGLLADDILILCVETADENIPHTPEYGWRYVGSVAEPGQTRLTVYAKRYSGTDQSTHVVWHASDHTYAVIFAIRGAGGLPNAIVGSHGTASGASQTLTFFGTDTAYNDSLITIIATQSTDIASTTSWSGWANANLGSVTERFDNSTNLGNGGGIGIATGTLATKGNIGSTTVVNAQTSPSWAALQIAWSPPIAPANNLFASAKIITPSDHGMKFTAADGATFDATLEASENASVLTGSLDRTQWWTYNPSSRIIAKIHDFRPYLPTSPGVTVSGGGSPDFQIQRDSSGRQTVGDASIGKSTSVDILTTNYDYVNIDAYPFGPNGLAGIFGRSGTSASNVVTYPSPTLLSPSSFIAVIPGQSTRFELVPGLPLYLQGGKGINYTDPDTFYQFTFELLERPTNDDFANALLLDPDNDGTLFYDLEPATIDPALSANPDWNFDIGDIWFRINRDSQKTIALQLQKINNPGDDTVAHFMSVFATSSIDDIVNTTNRMFVITGSGSGDDNNPEVQFTVTANTDFYLMLIENAGNPQLNWQSNLAWRWLDPPSNDNFADALTISGDSGSTSTADLNGASTEPPGSTRDIWYKFTPPTGGWYQFTLGNDPGNNSVDLIAYRGTSLDNLTEVNYALFSGTQTSATLALHGGETYYLALSTFLYTYDAGTFSWALLSGEPPKDDFANRQVITGASGSQSANIEGATGENGEPPVRYVSDFLFIDGTIWFEWTCPADGTYQFSTDTLNHGIAAKSEMAVWAGNPFSGGTKVTANAVGLLSLQQKLAFDAVSGTTYYIVIEVFREGKTDFIADVGWSFNLSWSTYTPPTNHFFANAIDLGTSYNDNLTAENFGLPQASEAGSPDWFAIANDPSWDLGLDTAADIGRVTWFKYVAPYTGNYDFTVDASGTVIELFPFQGTALDNLVSLRDGSGNITLIDAYLSVGTQNSPWHLTAGTTYYFAALAYEFFDSTDPLTNRVELYQGEFNIAWSLEPAANDNISSQSNTSAQNVGNLNWFSDYQYVGNPPQSYWSPNEGGCRSANNIACTAEPGEPSHGGGFPATRSVWFQFEPSTDGDYKFWVEGNGIDPVLDPVMSIYNWSSTIGGLGAALASDDDSGPGLYPQFTVTLSSFNRYLIAVDARDEGEFRLLFQLQPVGTPPANDNFANAIALTPGTPLSGTTVDSTVECGEKPAAGFWDGPYGSVWYKYTPSFTGVAAATVTTSGLSGIQDDQLLDVYSGTSLDNLVNITDADNINNASFNDTAFMPFAVTSGETYYIRVSSYDSGTRGSAPFTVALAEQSNTPPSNDNIDDAITVGSGSNPGTTDGSTAETGEADPFSNSGGGQLPSNAGSVWYKYVATTSGMIDVWAERTGFPDSQWYQVGIYEGPNKSSLTWTQPVQFNGYPARRYRVEIRAGQTYWLQVVRAADEVWGAFNLQITEYLENVDWSLDTDGFTTTNGSASVSSGVLTCSGGAGYGRVEVDHPALYRMFKIHFEMKITSGEILVNHGSTSGDVTNPANLARKLGIFRVLDASSANLMHCVLTDASNGENQLAFVSSSSTSGSASGLPISFGTRSQDEQGWVEIELECAYVVNGGVTVGIWIDGVFYGQTGMGANSPRYIDFGHWRYPSNGNTSNVEPTNTWTTQFRNVRVTNKVPRADYNFTGDSYNITHFDGFPNGTSFTGPFLATSGAQIPQGNFNTITVTGTTYPDIHKVGGGLYLPIVPAPGGKPWNAVRSQHPGEQAAYAYGEQWGHRRWYGFHFNAHQWLQPIYPPDPTDLALAGYATSPFFPNNSPITGYLAQLTVTQTGRLYITPWITPKFCVAQLALDQTYWIEVHVNCEVMWDVQCEVFINGVSFGIFSNKITQQQILSNTSEAITGSQASSYRNQVSIYFGSNPAANITNATAGAHEFYLANFVTGHGNPTGSAGPFRSVTVGAATGVGTHFIPDLAGWENRALRGFRQNLWEQDAWHIWGWNHQNAVFGLGNTHDETDNPDWALGTATFFWRQHSPRDDGVTIVTDGGLPTLLANLPASTSTFEIRYDDTRYYQIVNGAALGDMTMTIQDIKGTDGKKVAVAEWFSVGRLTGEEFGASTWSITLHSAYHQLWGNSYVLLSPAIGPAHYPLYEGNLAAGDTFSIQNFIMIQNPHVFPRFATTVDDTSQSTSGSDLNNPPWTRIALGESSSASFINADISVTSDGHAVFTDTTGALMRFGVNGGDLDWFPSAHRAYNMPWWYLEYTSDSHTGVVAANLWARWRGCYGPPKASTGAYQRDAGRLRTHITDGTNIRSGGKFFLDPPEAPSAYSNLPDNAVLTRYTVPRSPSGQAWSNFSGISVRLGFHSYVTDGQTYGAYSGGFGGQYQSDQRYGAAIYGLTWELLIPTAADAPPGGCGGIIPVHFNAASVRFNRRFTKS